jgi:diaminopimelate epimerase
MKFSKYQALGNDYLVVPGDKVLDPGVVERLCNRHYGVGSDGVLVGPMPSSRADFRLRIFNPDASEAEKSGNGLRIFCRYLWDNGLVKKNPFTVETAGGLVRAEILDKGRRIRIEMGTVSFLSEDIPVVGARREVLMEDIQLDGTQFKFCAATIGNPHCVIPVEMVDSLLANRYGPLVERHSNFLNHTNVQFLQVLDRGNIRIEIWERGAGYTLSSGSSSCAAAAVAHKLGMCDQNIVVHMPGGTIDIKIDDNYRVAMTGPVTHICNGEVSYECLA